MEQKRPGHNWLSFAPDLGIFPCLLYVPVALTLPLFFSKGLWQHGDVYDGAGLLNVQHLLISILPGTSALCKVLFGSSVLLPAFSSPAMLCKNKLLESPKLSGSVQIYALLGCLFYTENSLKLAHIILISQSYQMYSGQHEYHVFGGLRSHEVTELQSRG